MHQLDRAVTGTLERMIEKTIPACEEFETESARALRNHRQGLSIVTLSGAKGLLSLPREMLRFAQHDSPADFEKALNHRRSA